MLNIYHVPGTRSVRAIWACEELQVAYEVTPVDFSAEYRKSDEWRKLNPVGKVPAMTDGDFAMFESGAMMQYILDRYGDGQLQPTPGTIEHATYLQWCWFAEATFARPLGEVVNHRRAFGDDAQDAIINEMQGRALLCAKALDDVVATQDYVLAGGFSGADIMMGYSLLLCGRMAPWGDDCSNVSAYFDRLKARPAFAKASQ
jgi:glutathione S-transferase